MGLGNRIKELRGAMKKNQSEFAVMFDFKQTQISRLENDENDTLDIGFLTQLSNLGVNPTWLITGEGEMFLSNPSAPRSHYGVPVLDVAAAAGEGQRNETENQIATFYVAEEFRQYWGLHTKAIRIMGDSMEPTIPRNGWVLVRETKELLSEGIFVFMQDNELRCKRIQKKVNGDVIVISDNSQHYDKEVYPIGELLTQITVVAEVIGVLKRP